MSEYTDPKTGIIRSAADTTEPVSEPLKTITDAYIEAARSDLKNLETERNTYKLDIQYHEERIRCLTRSLDETQRLQKIAVDRLTQLEGAKING